jgi:hypothetical protein
MMGEHPPAFLRPNRSGFVTGSVIDRDQNVQGCHH